MPGVANGNSPSYISAHSADVILSDIRPIKLRPEALGAINVLLDEFLHIILMTSRSLSTEKMRSSLLTVLPTSLGKEALLEAEVELRAYSERTGSKALPEDDSRTFHLQWCFELLRLKCCAYSTLNEDDEDPAAEARINEMFSKAHSHSPQVALLDPAALYLTAIVESVCEHILANVGRVAARDSSRTYATTNDLFVALCEDDSIYGFFRSMRVYEQIAILSERPAPRHRRSKSISQHERASLSRASSSPPPEPSATTSSRSRQSSEGYATNITDGSRTSVEKMRMKESHKAHNKTDSIRSELLRQDSIYSTEDEAMQREFDDLMRSTSTMKVSLTPDRLKTMEAFKLEKDQKSSNRRTETLFPTKSTGAQASRKSSVGQIQSSNEDEQATKHRSHQGSISYQPISAFQAIVPTRLRSLSTSGSSWKKPARTLPVKRAPQVSYSFHSSSASINMPPAQKIAEKNGYPPRSRTKGRKRESMDLDDVMRDSDEETDRNSRGNQSPWPPINSKRPVHIPHKVSASTRDLIEFLAEGPPETPGLSKAGKELVDFLAEGPPDYASSTVSLDKSKGSGRLQKMMSKLNIGGTDKDKFKGGSEILKTPPRSTINPKASNGTLSSLANKPIPPRPPRPPNAPSSFPACDIPDENKAYNKPLVPDPLLRDPSSSMEKLIEEKKNPPPVSPPPPVDKTNARPPSAFAHTNGLANGSVHLLNVPPRTTSHLKPANKILPSPVPAPKPVPAIVEQDVRDMQRLITNATTADECRLILGMFMARSGIFLDPKLQEFTNRSPYVEHTPNPGVEASLENSLVEMLLGNSTSCEPVAA